LRDRRASEADSLGTSDAPLLRMQFRKILCPVDFSAGSRVALIAAAELARDGNASLVLAHVSETSSWQVMTGFQLVPEVIHQVADSEEAKLAEWKAHARELGVKEVATRLLAGAAWDQIVTAARDDRSIDLIVMGTHGRSGLKHALVGSVAEKTVRHAPCPVLVVRSPEAR
jgi:nucleotide-binding universal stress UspA family protein